MIKIPKFQLITKHSLNNPTNTKANRYMLTFTLHTYAIYTHWNLTLTLTLTWIYIIPRHS